MKNFVIFKDLNLLERKTKLFLAKEIRDNFMARLRRDVLLLTKLNSMDYSLLLGVCEQCSSSEMEAHNLFKLSNCLTGKAESGLDYYVGVIDILTPYSTFKKCEHYIRLFGFNQVTKCCVLLLYNFTREEFQL